MCDDRRTTDTDRKTVLADSGRRLADALRGGGADQVTVVLPGDEPLEFRVFVCRDAEEAAACLHRHGWGRERPEPVTRARPPARGVPARPRRGLRALG